MVAGDDRLLAGFPSGVHFTYSHTSMNSKSYIDFILLSDCVSSAVHDYDIIDYPLNLSDHLPVCLTIDWQNTSVGTGLRQSRNESGSNTSKDKRPKQSVAYAGTMPTWSVTVILKLTFFSIF